MVGLLDAMALMMLLLVGWFIWNNKPYHLFQDYLFHTEFNLKLQFCLLHSMDCQTNNLENSLPFHQGLGLIQLIFENYFLLEACSHKICFNAGNWKPVERKWFATTPTIVREVVWGFAWLQLNVPKALGWTPRFWQWNTLAADFSSD